MDESRVSGLKAKVEADGFAELKEENVALSRVSLRFVSGLVPFPQQTLNSPIFAPYQTTT